MSSYLRRIRIELMDCIIDFVQNAGLTQSQAAKLFGVSQPRMSDVMRQKEHLFSVDSLATMLLRAGFKIKLDYVKSSSTRRRSRKA